jgi:glycosyltransferase involved in cell wall biosynthesis
VGTFNLRKGAPDFAEIARRLLHRKDIQFVVAGPIHVPDAMLAKMPPNITFLGPVPRAAVADLYRSSDLLLLPAVSEGFGIVQIEAASHGLAVIATDRVGRFVDHGESGYVVELGDYDSVVAHLGNLADDRGKLHRMGQRAAEASRGFSPETYAGNIEKLVASLD